MILTRVCVCVCLNECFCVPFPLIHLFCPSHSPAYTISQALLSFSYRYLSFISTMCMPFCRYSVQYLVFIISFVAYLCILFVRLLCTTDFLQFCLIFSHSLSLFLAFSLLHLTITIRLLSSMIPGYNLQFVAQQIVIFLSV